MNDRSDTHSGPDDGSADDLDWSRVASILDAVLDHPPDRRQEALDEACGNDAALRAEVEAMLEEEARAEAMFTGGVAAMATAWDDVAAAVTEWESDADLAGTRLGPYEVGPEIGRGGMGRVYRASRADGTFEQDVAIKVIRRGLAPDAVQRFLAERHFLADLAHPGIARLLDGGVTPDGRPFLVMEYVDGVSITDYCQEHRLSLQARLNLFVQVCRAVHYAHTRLVVHRDLKPANILVVPPARGTGSGPTVKLLDFGIAKALDGARTASPVETQTGQFIVTPAYAAPEQLTGGEVTTATDVYALGAILHELLTGTRPHPDASVEDRVRHARSGDAPPPPARAFADRPDDERDALARSMHLSPQSVEKHLRTDLGLVIGTALSPDTELRYDGADGLAGDVERYLADRPVTARPASMRYRVRKFAARNPSLLAGVSLAVTALVVGLVVALWQADVAATERDRARQEAEKAEQVASFMRDLFRSNDPTVALGDTVSVAEILRRGQSRVLSELAEQPEVQLSMAAEIAEIHMEMGNASTAESLLVAAQAAAPSSLTPSDEIARLLYLHGRTRDYAGDAAEAERLHRNALEIRRSLHGDVHEDVGRSLNQVASMLTYQGRYEEARPLYLDALRILAQTSGREHEAYTSTMHNLAWMTRTSGDLAGADSLYQRAYSLALQTLPPQHPEILLTLNGLALVRKARGRYASADTLYRMVLRKQQAILGPSHPTTGISHSNLGMLLKAMDRPEEAARHVQAALDVWTAALGPRHPYVAVGLSNLGMIHFDRGDYDAAETALRRALDIHREVLPEGHPRLASTLIGLGRVLTATGRFEAAEQHLDEGRALRASLLPDGHPDRAAARLALAELHARRGNVGQARTHLITARESTCSSTRSPDDLPPICSRLEHRLETLQ